MAKVAVAVDRRLPEPGIEEALRRSEERFRVMAEGMPHTVWESDSTGRTLYTNSRWAAYVGDEAATVEGLDWLHFYHPEDRAYLLAEWEECVRTDGAHPYAVEVRIRRHDGVYRWFRATGAPIKNLAGQIVKWVGTCIDIDERKQAELALRELQASTARSLALLDTLQAHVPIGIAFVDRDCRYVRVNDRLAAMNGISGDAHIGRRISDVVPALWSQIEPIYRRVLAGEAVLDAEISGSRPSCPGEIRHWLVSYYPVSGSSEIAGIGLMVQDITERRRSEQREQVRNTVLAMIVAGTPLPDILDAVVRGAEQQLPGVWCSILLLDVFGTRLIHGAAPSLPDFYTAAIDGVEIGPTVGSCGAATYRGERVVAADIASHPYWQDYKGLAAAAGLASCWSEPIRASSGKVLGAFAIYHPQPAEPGERELELLANAANLASIAIEHRQNDEALDMAASVYQAIGEAIMVTDAKNCIAAVNPAFTRLTGYLPADVVGKDPKLLSSSRQDRAFYRRMWQALESTGRWQGEVWNRTKDGREFAEWLMINSIYDSDGRLQRRIALFSDITDQKKSEETIWHQANYDPLTLLPNRRLFHDRLGLDIKRSARAGKSLALMLIDLDHFKEVNDSLGHDAGDALLIEAAQRIQDCVRSSDTVARLGGDEFTIILSDLVETLRIDEVAQAIVDSLSRPFQLREELVYVSASIGISLFPGDAETITDLVKNADQAMYAAKREGRRRFCYFIPSMQAHAHYRLQLMRDLRGALAGGQFQVYFQPIVNLASGRTLKAEALLRWFHPQRGLIGPADFIPLAEDTGLINDIGDWVFRESARQLAHWQRLSGQSLQVSVNMSPLQILSCDACTRWGEYLQELGLSGENVVLEVTERLLLADHPEVIERLARFRAAGVSVAIDDFGTGYSALSYLKKFKVDYLKIDRSFIRDLAADANDRALVEAIIVMAHKLGIRVIAEGVETAEQRRFLIAAGCDYGQGFLFARPLPAAEFEALVLGANLYCSES